jgi:hypothetical protein
MAAAVTGGGTGYLQITGAPYAQAASTRAIGSCLLSGVDYTASASLTLSFISSGSTSALYFAETNDNGATSNLQISGLGANDVIIGSISYETDDT